MEPNEMGGKLAEWLRSFLASAATLSLRDGVAVFARLTIIGFLLYGVDTLAGLPRWALIGLAVGLALHQRQAIGFGSLLGSARYLGLPEMRKAGYFGRRGLLLGRAKENGGFLTCLGRLFTRPLCESDAAVRTFLGSVIRHRLELRRHDDGPALFFPKYVHLLTVAPAGAGKGVGFVVPNLLRYPHSVVVTDVKSGENHKLTAHHRKAMGQTVVTLDPYGVRKVGSACINPLDALLADSPTLLEDARGLADSLVIRTGHEKDTHFNDLAVTLLQAFIVFTVAHVHEGDRHLNTVRYLLSGAGRVKEILETMRVSSFAGGMLADLGAFLDGIPEKEFGSVVTSAYKNLDFLGSPLLKEHFSRTSFPLEKLSDGMSVYLVLPAEYLDSHAALVRLWVNTLLLAKKKAGLDEKKEVLFLLDECGNLGDMKPLENAVTVGRGFGLRMWFVLQSIKQIESNFPPPRSDTIIAGCGIKVFFGINDLSTAEYVSKMAGKQTVTMPSINRGSSWGSVLSASPQSSSNRGTGHGAGQRDLITPDEVMRSPGEVFIFVEGKAPILANRLAFFDDSEFAGDRASDPQLCPEQSESGHIFAPSLVSWAVCCLGLWFGLPLLWESVNVRPLLAWWPSHPAAVASSEAPVTDAEAVAIPYRPVPAPAPPPKLAECPDCGNRGPIPPGYSGETLDCRNCGTSFILPD